MLADLLSAKMSAYCAKDPFQEVHVRMRLWKTSCGRSTWPTRRMRALPSFCFSSSFRFLRSHPIP